MYNDLVDGLRDFETAQVYAEELLNACVATQIRVLREQRDMSQSDLAQQMGTSQAAISRIENINYSAWNIRTLRKVATALGVRLKISFETFGSLLSDIDFTRESLQRPSHADDPLWAASSQDPSRLRDLHTEATVAQAKVINRTSYNAVARKGPEREMFAFIPTQSEIVRQVNAR